MVTGLNAFRDYFADDTDKYVLKVMPIVMELSKTNYIYTPIRSRDNDELEQLFGNLLEGELKNKYYSEVFNAYLNAWNQVMVEYFGDNWKNKI